MYSNYGVAARVVSIWLIWNRVAGFWIRDISGSARSMIEGRVEQDPSYPIEIGFIMRMNAEVCALFGFEYQCHRSSLVMAVAINLTKTLAGY